MKRLQADGLTALPGLWEDKSRKSGAKTFLCNLQYPIPLLLLNTAQPGACYVDEADLELAATFLLLCPEL